MNTPDLNNDSMNNNLENNNEGQATIPAQTPIQQAGEGNAASGVFATTLRRSNSKIREDRALAISEDAQLIYRREIEDMQLQHKKLTRERDNMLDLSPRDAQSLVLAAEFDAKGFTAKDIQIGVNLRNLEIKLEIAKARYEYLFGEKIA